MKWDWTFQKGHSARCVERPFVCRTGVKSTAGFWFAQLLMVSCVTFGVSAVTFISPSTAAMRLCKGVVTSSAFTKADELSARRHALADWMQRSVELGITYPAWRIATRRSMRCAQRKDVVTCVARAAPCTISQKPRVPGPKPSQAVGYVAPTDAGI